MTDAVINWYDKVGSKHKSKSYNPHYENHLMELPFRAMIIGKTGSMKTNLLLEIIHRMRDTFDVVMVCCKNKNESLYNLLEDKLDANIVFFEGIENIPALSDIDLISQDPELKKSKLKRKPQILCVFDDLMMERDQKRIIEYFFRGRKVLGGISCVYITQSYFKTPKTIRLQCDYIFLKQISSNNDLFKIIDEFNLGKDRQMLLKLYKDSTSDKISCFTIDTLKDDYKFRKNFLEIYDL